MKILISGGAGFIGSAVVRSAISRGDTVINVDALKYSGNLKNLQKIKNNKNYIFEHADICNLKEMQRIIKEYEPDSVMHLAAESHVDRSIDGPEIFINTNVIGTFNLLEATKDYWFSIGKPKDFRFLHVSTDEVYGSLGPKGKFTEETPYNPRSPYSASKAASDHLVRSWGETFELPILITNCSNNYGEYQFPEKLIPTIIINALAGNSLPIYGNGENIRDWLFVDDHINALLLVLDKGTPGRTYNIGADNELTNLEIVKKICSILDNQYTRVTPYAELISFVEDRPGHDKRYSIDSTRIRSELGWKPHVSFSAGLEKTVQWYINNQNWWGPLQKIHSVKARLGSGK